VYFKTEYTFCSFITILILEKPRTFLGRNREVWATIPREVRAGFDLDFSVHFFLVIEIYRWRFRPKNSFHFLECGVHFSPENIDFIVVTRKTGSFGYKKYKNFELTSKQLKLGRFPLTRCLGSCELMVDHIYDHWDDYQEYNWIKRHWPIPPGVMAHTSRWPIPPGVKTKLLKSNFEKKVYNAEA